MPLRECYCGNCEQQRAEGLRNRPATRSDLPTHQQEMYDSVTGRYRMFTIHLRCDSCGWRNTDQLPCHCVPCQFCGGLLGLAPSRTHRQCTDCLGTQCAGTCRCMEQVELGYGAVPHTVVFRSVSELGLPIEALGRVPSREERRVLGTRYPMVPDSEPYLGLEVELEMESERTHTDKIVRTWARSGLGWATHDSSLRNGTECKTHPSTYGWLAQSSLVETLDTMQSLGARSWSTDRTGLHCHVSRKAFASKAHEYVFAWLQTSAMREQCLVLAGRQDAHYAEWPTKAAAVPTVPVAHSLSELTVEERRLYDRHIGTSSSMNADFLFNYINEQRTQLMPRTRRTQSPLRVIAGKESNGNRSVAINVCASTIELRYWKGTVCSSSVLGQCAFVDALIRYSRTVRVSSKTVDAIGWASFSQWCVDTLPDSQVTDIANLCANRGASFIVPSNTTENETSTKVSEGF